MLKPKISPAFLKKIAEEEVVKAFASVDEASVRAEMKKIIDRELGEIIMKALGIERDPWSSGLRVSDSSSSLLGQAIRQHAGSAVNPEGGVVRDLVEQAIKDWIGTIKPSKAEIEATRKMYRDAYVREIQAKAQEMAKKQATIDFPELIAKLDQLEDDEE